MWSWIPGLGAILLPQLLMVSAIWGLPTPTTCYLTDMFGFQFCHSLAYLLGSCTLLCLQNKASGLYIALNSLSDGNTLLRLVFLEQDQPQLDFITWVFLLPFVLKLFGTLSNNNSLFCSCLLFTAMEMETFPFWLETGTQPGNTLVKVLHRPQPSLWGLLSISNPSSHSTSRKHWGIAEHFITLPSPILSDILAKDDKTPS